MNNINKMSRMWINQPSSLQPYHDMHGMNVLVDMTSKDSHVTVYYTEGAVISSLMGRNLLSTGWRMK